MFVLEILGINSFEKVGLLKLDKRPLNAHKKQSAQWFFKGVNVPNLKQIVVEN